MRRPGTFAAKAGSIRVAPPRCVLAGSRRSISSRGLFMNNIIYIVGLIVIVLAILSFLGLR
jgi:small-conductance mechanosensitive channel